MSIEGTRAVPRLELGQAMSEFALENDQFIGMKALVPCSVAKDAAKYPKIVRESILEVVDVKRAADGTYNRSGFKMEDGSYACLQYGQEQRLDDAVRARFANDFDAEDWAGKIATRRVLQAQELRIKGKLFNTGTWTGAALATTVSTAWSNIAATMQADVLAACEKVRQNCGIKPNALIMGRSVLNTYIMKNTEVKEAIKFNQIVTVQGIINALAAYFDIPNILIGGGVYNSAKEGQTFAGADMWGTDYVMVAVAAGSPGAPVIEPCVGRTFAWEAVFTPESVDKLIETGVYREEQTESDIMRAKQTVDECIHDPYFAHLIDIIP
jgi:hypothetical protein